MKRRKLPSLRSLQKKADIAFAKYIRNRQDGHQGISSIDGLWCHCVTCKAFVLRSETDCGHFWKRQYLGTRYDERNCARQCRKCNRFQGGRQAEFAAYIIKTYGPEVFDEMERKHREIIKPTREWYQAVIDKYSS